MISRRQFVQVTLAGCGCITCAIGNVRADEPTTIQANGYDLSFIGAQRDTITNGKLAAALDLNSLSGREHLYGIGPIEQLRGEVTILDSRPALARVATDGSVRVTESFQAGVPFLVWSVVPQWRQKRIPPEVRSYDDLERFLPQAAAEEGLDPEKPFPFLVGGDQQAIEFHIVNRVGDAPHNMEMHGKIQVAFELENAAAAMVGFYSVGTGAYSHPPTAICTSIFKHLTTPSLGTSRSCDLAKALS